MIEFTKAKGGWPLIAEHDAARGSVIPRELPSGLERRSDTPLLFLPMSKSPSLTRRRRIMWVTVTEKSGDKVEVNLDKVSISGSLAPRVT
jgi:hypothetical protein